MHCRTMAIISTFLTISHLAVSAEPPKPNVYGAGAASCSAWLDERSKAQGGTSELLLAWALGYMTAMEAIRNITHVPTNEQRARTFLDGFCEEHPDAKFNVAAAELSYSQRSHSSSEAYEQLSKRLREVDPVNRTRG